MNAVKIAIVDAVTVVNVIASVTGIASRVRTAVVRAIMTTTTDARNVHAVGTATAGEIVIVTRAPGAAVLVAAEAVAMTTIAVGDVARAVAATNVVAVIAATMSRSRIAAVGNAAVESAAVAIAAVVIVPM